MRRRKGAQKFDLYVLLFASRCAQCSEYGVFQEMICQSLTPKDSMEKKGKRTACAGRLAPWLGVLCIAHNVGGLLHPCLSQSVIVIITLLRLPLCHGIANLAPFNRSSKPLLRSLSFLSLAHLVSL